MVLGSCGGYAFGCFKAVAFEMRSWSIEDGALEDEVFDCFRAVGASTRFVFDSDSIPDNHICPWNVLGTARTC